MVFGKDNREMVGNELSEHGFSVRSFADGDSLLGSLEAAADADVSSSIGDFRI
jgi:hypothetical protein